MAMTGNINPWSAGAVVFDTRPFAAFYERQMLRQQAKQDTLDNYFRDLNKNITSAGMRSQDVPGLLQKNKQWQDYYQQNKPAIINPKLDNGQAYSQYMSLYQDQLGHVNQSKEEHKKKDELNKLRFNKDFSYVFDDPTIMDDIAADDLPLNDPQRKRLDIGSLVIPPKPVDVKELDSYNKYLTGGIPHDKIPGQVENIGGFKTRTPIYTQYSPENQLVIGQHAMNAYDTDKRWRYEANKTFKELMSDPEMYKRYNTTYKNLYGSDIDTPKEAWAAKGIIDNNMKATEYKEGKDEKALLDYKFAQDKVMEGLRFGHQRQLKKEEQGAVDNWIVNYWGQRIGDAKAKAPQKFGDPNNPLTIKIGYELEPDRVMLEGLSRNGVQPDAVYVTADDKIMPVFYKTQPIKDEQGNVIKGAGEEVVTDENGDPVIDKDYSKPMRLDQAYLSLGYRGQTKKDLGGTMSGTYGGQKPGAKYALPAGKPRTVKQNGHVYTWNENSGNYE